MNYKEAYFKQKEMIELLKFSHGEQQNFKYYQKYKQLESELQLLEELPEENESLFLAMYNPMIYESSFGIISVHKTRKGAEMAIEFHKNEARKEWEEIYPTKALQKESPFGSFEAWEVYEIELSK